MFDTFFACVFLLKPCEGLKDPVTMIYGFSSRAYFQFVS